MPHPRMSGEEAQRRGDELYAKELRQQVETGENIGKFLVIDVETGDYEIDTDELAAVHRALAKRPDAVLWEKRIGYNAAHALGGSLTRTTR
jgi:hypothetical protein